EAIDVHELIRDPAARRLWMLYKAATFLPLGDALELACAAEMFVSGSRSGNRAASDNAIQPHDAIQPDQQRHIVAQSAARASAGSEAAAHSSISRPNRHVVGEDQRDRLLARLAEGAKNAELALEFGLSPKQVQGFRMGSAREIARRRAHTGNAFEAEQEASPTAIIDDIVRYLRQQDDVVVLQEDGGYLVNGRFRMTASELVARANRMRMRQRRPAFEVANGALSSGAPAANSHTLFGEEPPANEPLVTNGFHKSERREPDVQLIRADHCPAHTGATRSISFRRLAVDFFWSEISCVQRLRPTRMPR